MDEWPGPGECCQEGLWLSDPGEGGDHRPVVVLVPGTPRKSFLMWNVHSTTASSEQCVGGEAGGMLWVVS